MLFLLNFKDQSGGSGFPGDFGYGYESEKCWGQRAAQNGGKNITSYEWWAGKTQTEPWTSCAYAKY